MNQHTPELPCFLLSWQWPLHWPLCFCLFFSSGGKATPSHSSASQLSGVTETQMCATKYLFPVSWHLGAEASGEVGNTFY